MSTTIDSVIAQLQETGIVPADKLAEFIPPAATPTDPKAWTAQLVERGLLTPFQATQTAQGKAKSLVIGAYEMVDRLTGGGGLLFKARHRRMKRPVMIKPLAPSLMKAAGPRVLADVEAIGQLQHPNIVAIQDVDEVGGAHFLVAEFFEATNLATLLQQQGKLAPAVACKYAAQAAAGLAQAHAKGVVHRDVKAENLFVVVGGVVKVLGFGLTTNQGDARGDVRALGQMLLKLLGDAELPPALKAYIEQMTSADAVNRPAMAEVAAKLAAPETLLQPVAAAPEEEAFPELFAAAEEEVVPSIEVGAVPELVISSPEPPISIAADVAPPAAAPITPVVLSEFAISAAPKPAAAAAKKPAVETPVMNFGTIGVSDAVEEPIISVSTSEPSAVIPADAEETDEVGTINVAMSSLPENSLGISVAPSTTVSSASKATVGRMPAARGKKSSLPFKIDPKYLTPKYLFAGGAAVIVVLSVSLIAVVATKKKSPMPEPVRAVKAVPPKPAATIQFLPPSDSLNTVRPSTAPPPTSRQATSPPPAQPETLFGLPVTPAPTPPKKP